MKRDAVVKQSSARSNGITQYEHPHLLLAIFGASALMTAIDAWIVNVGLRQIGHDIGQGPLNDLTWILNAYTIIFAALLVPAGRIGDHFGNKRVFISGLGLFTFASFGCAVSSNLWLIVAFRVVQAIGAAAIVPSSLGLILTTIAPERRHHAIRIWTILGSVGAAAGPVLGGLLVAVSWRWIFVINVPIGSAAAIVAMVFVPDVRHHSQTQIPDWVGGALLILSIGGLALGLVQGSEWGWGSPATIGSFAVTIVGALLFVARSLRAETPIVNFHLFEDRAFARANLPIFLVNLGFGLQLLGLILLMQVAWGWSALVTGLAIAPGPVMVSVAALGVRPHLPKRLPDGRVAAIGIFMQAVGGILIGIAIGRHANYFGGVLPGWMLIGAGVGIWLPTVITAGSANLAPHQSATGSAVLQMGRWIGSTIGVSLLVVILGSSGGAGAPIGQFKNIWWWAALPAVIGAICALTLPQRSSSRSSASPSADTKGAELAAH